MYNILYKLFFYLRRVEKREYKIGGFKYKTAKKIIGYIEAYYNLHIVEMYMKYPKNQLGVTTEKRKQRIIVSLTSFPKRIDTLWITVETLLRQTMKPDEIILWLAEEQFNGIDSVPQKLLEQQKRGLTIRFCDDLRSHKKYYYAMQEYPEDLIVLVDDDAFYPYDTIEKLMKLHKKNPDEIVCMTPAIITGDDMPPSLWRSPKHNEKIEHSIYAQPFTGQGTLYPPHSLDEKYAFRKDLILELCPYADDLWLKYMSLRKKVLGSSIYKFRSIPVNIYGTGENSLWYINGLDNKNDTQWKALLEYFNDFDLKEVL